MPYTENSQKRPRTEQVKDPKTPGELTLAYTVACLDYIKETKKNYTNMARCMAALDPSETVKPFRVKKVEDLSTLRRHIAHLTQVYILHNHHSDYELDIKASKICAQQEWYWKMMRPYEDNKCRENGEVYPLPHSQKIFIKPFKSSYTDIEQIGVGKIKKSKKRGQK
jgi:hypothetical protein